LILIQILKIIKIKNKKIIRILIIIPFFFNKIISILICMTYDIVYYISNILDYFYLYFYIKVIRLNFMNVAI